MTIFLIKDCFRISDKTGTVIETEFEKDFEKYYDEITLESGKNEYVSFQVVYEHSCAKLDEIDIKFSDLIGESNICCTQYSVFVEWFHKIKGVSTPDALIPLCGKSRTYIMQLLQNTKEKQNVTVFWVDLFISANTPPNEYLGTITASINSQKREFNIRINVFDSALSNKSSIYADLNNYTDSISIGFDKIMSNEKRYSDGSFCSLEKEFYKMSYDHRCIFHNLPYGQDAKVLEGFAPQIEGRGNNIRIKSWDSYDSHFGPYLDGSAFKESQRGAVPIPFLYLPFNFGWPANYENWGKKGYETEFKIILEEFARHFEEKGWNATYLEMFFNHKKRYRQFPYDGDETRFLEDEVIINIFGDFSKKTFDQTKAKFVFRMDSSWAYGLHFDSKYADIIKMWVANNQIFSWFKESVQKMNDRNNILWTYGGLSGIDEPHTAILAWPISCVMKGTTGFTLWNTTGFGENFMETPIDNGEQTIMYPGEKFGFDAPIASIRLKVMRNCMQIADRIMGLEKDGRKKDSIKVLNRYFESSIDSWWNKKPAFVNTPPCTWKNEQLSVAAPTSMHKGISPIIIEKIKSEILSLSCGNITKV